MGPAARPDRPALPSGATPRRWRRPTVLVVVAAAVLAACSGPGGAHAGRRTAPVVRLGDPVAGGTAPAAGTAPTGTYEIRAGGALSTPSPIGWRVLAVVPDGRVLSFATRPARGPASVPVSDLTDRWPALAPNGSAPAALVGTSTDGTPVSLAVDLADPAWNGADDTLLITVRPSGADRAAVLPAAFADLTLHLDGARPRVEVDVSNPTSVPLVPRPADPSVPWSTVGGVDPVSAVGGTAAAIGLDQPAGTDLDLLVDDPDPGVPAEVRLAVTGGDDNVWLVTVSWDADGRAGASVAQLAGSGIRLADVPDAPMGTPVALRALPSAGTGVPTRFPMRFDAS